MSEAEELARRYLALWTEYLTALAADPKAADLVRRWIAGTGLPATHGKTGEGADPDPGRATGPQAGAAPSTGAFGERDLAVAELARRLAELEQRVAGLERANQPAAASRSRNRRVRT